MSPVERFANFNWKFQLVTSLFEKRFLLVVSMNISRFSFWQTCLQLPFSRSSHGWRLWSLLQTGLLSMWHVIFVMCDLGHYVTCLWSPSWVFCRFCATGPSDFFRMLWEKSVMALSFKILFCLCQVVFSKVEMLQVTTRILAWFMTTSSGWYLGLIQFMS
jgi:hypothetical protein